MPEFPSSIIHNKGSCTGKVSLWSANNLCSKSIDGVVESVHVADVGVDLDIDECMFDVESGTMSVSFRN